MGELYQFERLNKRLDELGFPLIQGNSGFKIIRTDFKVAYNAGKISFEEDGIYLEYEGKKHRGYMFMPSYRIKHYNDFPRFHLRRCDVIEDFLSGGKFHQYYTWSNSNVNDIKDRDTQKEHKNITLKLCNRCRTTLLNEIQTTEDFFNTLDISEMEETVEIDINGYTRNWDKISKAFRKKKEYTCEHCGVKMEQSLDYRYLHTHHLNGDKTNNKESNLECLCILCHSHKDISHEENFDKKRMRKQIQTFVDKYREKLKSNPYLKKFEQENNG